MRWYPKYASRDVQKSAQGDGQGNGHNCIIVGAISTSVCLKCMNLMQSSPRNSIKREKIYNNIVIHALTMNNKDKYQSSSREEPPYTMYWVHKK